jgi:hypothetical protein
MTPLDKMRNRGLEEDSPLYQGGSTPQLWAAPVLGNVPRRLRARRLSPLLPRHSCVLKPTCLVFRQEAVGLKDSGEGRQRRTIPFVRGSGRTKTLQQIVMRQPRGSSRNCSDFGVTEHPSDKRRVVAFVVWKAEAMLMAYWVVEEDLDVGSVNRRRHDPPIRT